jgi:antitoxin YokJ
MGVAVTHRLHPARLGRCYASFHEVHRIPGSCEIIAASFSAMVMEFLNDPGNGWVLHLPRMAHVRVTPTKVP